MSNYKRGANFERRIRAKEERKGNLAIRSSGSHTIIDLVIIDKQNKIIKLIQCKPASQRNKDGELNAEGKRIEAEIKQYEGEYMVYAEVLTTRKIKKPVKNQDSNNSIPKP